MAPLGEAVDYDMQEILVNAYGMECMYCVCSFINIYSESSHELKV